MRIQLTALVVVATALLLALPAVSASTVGPLPAAPLLAALPAEARINVPQINLGEFRPGDAGLTLDKSLQHTVDRLLKDAQPQWGGAVVVEVKSGKVLAFSQYRQGEQPRYQELATRLAPTASVFKIVTTAALLERTPVTVNTRVCVAGGQHGIGRRHLVAPTRGVVQCMPFFHALGFSVNAAYAQLVTRYLSRSDLVGMVERFGFDRPLLFDAPALLGHVTVPSDDLSFARTSIGFENTALTVLGAAHLALTVAREGKTGRMHLLEGGAAEFPSDAEPAPERILRATTARRLQRMMELTVHGGTALDSFTNEQTERSYLADIRVAGKTGTLHEKNQSRAVSWFTGFAPARAPQVVVTVLLENGATWRRKAADVARDILRAHFAGHRGVTPPF